MRGVSLAVCELCVAPPSLYGVSWWNAATLAAPDSTARAVPALVHHSDLRRSGSIWGEIVRNNQVESEDKLYR